MRRFGIDRIIHYYRKEGNNTIVMIYGMRDMDINLYMNWWLKKQYL